MTPSPEPAPRLAKSAAVVATTLIWGSTFLAISVGNDTVPPAWAATLRLAIAAAALFAILAMRRQPLPRGEAMVSAVLYGFFQFGLNLPLLYWAETEVPSGLCAVIFATLPLNNALLTHLFGLERLTLLKVGGAVLALAGVAVIFSAQVTLAVEPRRLFAVLIATWAAGLGSVFLKRGPRQSPIGANAVGATVGMVICLFTSILLGESQILPHGAAAWFPIFYLAVAASLGAFVMWAWLLNHSNITRISYISVVVPIVALVLGILVRGEHPAPASFPGAAIVLAGVALGVRVPARLTEDPDKTPADLAPPSVAE
jgi:drug/metabolite transporter (DMT)-like permease